MKLQLLLLFSLCLLLLGSCQLQADPWGKDADLAAPKKHSSSTPKNCPTPILGGFSEIMIRFHQKVVSPADGPRSHFIPCSSQYTLNAMRKHGFFTGFTMGCDRLMRENKDPWIYQWTRDREGQLIKYDPVP